MLYDEFAWFKQWPQQRHCRLWQEARRQGGQLDNAARPVDVEAYRCVQGRYCSQPCWASKWFQSLRHSPFDRAESIDQKANRVPRIRPE